MIERRLISTFELWFVLAILLILGMGVLSIYSVTSIEPSRTGMPVYMKQMVWIAGGWVLFLLFAFYDYHKMMRYSLIFYVAVVFLLVLVLIVGRSGRGAQRWLSLGFFDLQPSEWIKIALILVVARYFSSHPRPNGLGFSDLITPFVFLLVPLLLVFKQPDLGTALSILFIFSVMIFLAGLRARRVGFFILVSFMALPFLWEFFWKSLRDYQRHRFAAFLNPNLDPMGQGYHALQSKIAIGSGGWIGKGLWGGTQSQLDFLPEGHTDFIFSVFAEEWGFLGVLILFALYLFLIGWGIETAYKAKDPMGSLLAGGIVGMLTFGILVNIGMTVGVVPVVGVPLPLMSYGGNSIVTTLAALGLLLNIRMRRFMLFY